MRAETKVADGAPTKRRAGVPRVLFTLLLPWMLAGTLGVLSTTLPAGVAVGSHHEEPGLSTEQRKTIFVALSHARERANREAAAASKSDPESSAQEALAAKLSKKYRGAVLKKFGIGPKQAEKIVYEAYEKGWSTVDPSAVRTTLD